MDDNQGLFDSDTGEVLSNSDAAIAASARAQQNAIMATLGVGNAQLYAALMAAVAKLPVWITTDKENPAYKNNGKVSKYASLKTILETVRPILLQEGLRIRQGADRSFMLDEGGGSKGRLVPVYTDLIHTESGQVDRTVIEIPVTRMDPGAMGSAISYGRRYSLLAALGLATDEADDDGEDAKPRDLSPVQASDTLLVLKREIDAIKEATNLHDWGSKLKAQKRADKLSENEHLLLRQHYQQRLAALVAAPIDDEPVKKPKRAAE